MITHLETLGASHSNAIPVGILLTNSTTITNDSNGALQTLLAEACRDA